MFAIVPPAATIDWHSSNVAGTPTASIAQSTPAPSVSFMISVDGFRASDIDTGGRAERARHFQPVRVDGRSS